MNYELLNVPVIDISKGGPDYDPVPAYQKHLMEHKEKVYKIRSQINELKVRYVPLNFHPKGVRRARAVLGDSETQDPWWCGGMHPPDMGIPTYGSALIGVCRVTPTAGILLGPKYSCM